MHNLLLVVFYFFIQTEVLATDLQLLDITPESVSSSKQMLCTSPNEFRKKSISFSGGSYFSVTYCIGVFDVLQKFFDLSNVVYLGDSSGSITATAAALNIPMDHAIKEFLLPSLQEKQNMPHCGFSQWNKVVTKNLFSTIRKFNPDLIGQAHKIFSGKLYHLPQISIKTVGPIFCW
jgi:hypothetical protein